MPRVTLPIEYGDNGQVARDKINNSFEDVCTTVEGYRPHIESGIWWIGNTNTGVQAKGDDVSMKVEDGYIWYKSSSVNTWTQIIAIADLKGDTGASIISGEFDDGDMVFTKDDGNTVIIQDAEATLTGPQGEPGQDGADGTSIVSAAFDEDDIDFTDSDGNVIVLEGAKTALTGPQGEPGQDGQDGTDGEDGVGIASVTSTKVGKTTTVTITLTDGSEPYTFNIEDGADGQGSGDVIGPASSTDGHLAVFDGSTGKLIKDGGAVPTPTTVVDDLTTQSSTSALSANQGYVLKGLIDDLMAQGHFLSLWNCATGLAISFPPDTPYTYKTGDYFMVEIVDSSDPATNYRPNGSSYSGTASSTEETNEVAVGDYYVYDGTVWLLATNHGKTVSFANLAGQPSDNTALNNELNVKRFNLSNYSDTTTGQAIYDYLVTTGKHPIVVYNNETYLFSGYVNSDVVFRKVGITCSNYSNQAQQISVSGFKLNVTSGTVTEIIGYTNSTANPYLATNVDYSSPYTPAYDGSPATKKYVDDNVVQKGSTAPASPSEGMLWYDTTNDVLKTYDGTNWLVSGYSVVDDSAFSSSWDGVTDKSPSMNAVYDILGDVETLLANI